MDGRVDLPLLALGLYGDGGKDRMASIELVTLWAEAGTDQITLNATFSDPTSGAVKINWSAN